MSVRHHSEAVQKTLSQYDVFSINFIEFLPYFIKFVRAVFGSVVVFHQCSFKEQLS